MVIVIVALLRFEHNGCRLMAQQDIPTDSTIAEKAKTLIVADLATAYSVAQLATACGVSVFTLQRIFKKETDVSISTFTLWARIERAKDLLATTNNTLQMIAEMTGYTEGNNFQLAFKRVVGCTPGEWRKQFGER